MTAKLIHAVELRRPKARYFVTTPTYLMGFALAYPADTDAGLADHQRLRPKDFKENPCQISYLRNLASLLPSARLDQGPKGVCRCFPDSLFLFATVACFVVLGILLFGIGTFAKGGEFNKRNANRIMRWRIGVQFVVVVCIVAFAWRRSRG